MHRLLLALLIVCLALPAVAVEACAPPARPGPDTAMHGHHAPPAPADEDREQSVTAQHVCIGCAPPLMAPALPGKALAVANPFASEPPILNIASPYPPIPPPPRSRA